MDFLTQISWRYKYTALSSHASLPTHCPSLNHRGRVACKYPKHCAQNEVCVHPSIHFTLEKSVTESLWRLGEHVFYFDIKPRDIELDISQDYCLALATHLARARTGTHTHGRAHTHTHAYTHTPKDTTSQHPLSRSDDWLGLVMQQQLYANKASRVRQQCCMSIFKASSRLPLTQRISIILRDFTWQCCMSIYK